MINEFMVAFCLWLGTLSLLVVAACLAYQTFVDWKQGGGRHLAKVVDESQNDTSWPEQLVEQPAEKPAATSLPSRGVAVRSAAAGSTDETTRVGRSEQEPSSSLVAESEAARRVITRTFGER
jgi:hypothetical protein